MAEPIEEVRPKRRALNAYRHGLTGQVVIRTQSDREAYDKHCKTIHATYLRRLNRAKTHHKARQAFARKA